MDLYNKANKWMENLPEEKKTLKLTQLAIPGSHNSSTLWLDSNGPITSEKNWIIKLLSHIPFAKKDIVFKWSQTQSMNFGKQLDLGIRYFDMRTYYYKGDFYAGHGLYGPKMCDSLTDINMFLEKNKEEVVILDFNHFYDFTEELHDEYIRVLRGIFGSKLCPADTDITLLNMVKNNYQVIAAYHDDNAAKNNKEHLWPKSITPLDACYANTANIHELECKLDNFYSSRPQNITSFFVLQGILTPNTGMIATHLKKSLEEVCALPASEFFVPWLKNKKTKIAGGHGINICIMDYVEMNEFVQTVIELNSD